MKKENSLIASVLIGLSLFIGIAALLKPSTQTVVTNDPNVGGQSGQNQSGRQFFDGGATLGGTKLATTTTAATYTTVAKDFVGLPTIWAVTPNLNTTLSLSSTSTLAYVPNIGDTAQIYLLNASTTAAATITFAAVDANQDLQFAEATGGDLVLNGLDWEKVTLIRTSKYKVTMILDEMTEAD